MKERMRKGIVFGIAILMVMVMIVITVPMSVRGDTLTVGEDKDYEEINDAIKDAKLNDEIAVYEGTYDPISVGKSFLTIYSMDGKENTIIDGGGSGDVVTITTGDVEIIGFTIQNSGSNGNDAGIKISGALMVNNFIIADCIITDNVNGIYLDNTQNCEIYINDIGNNDRGIYVKACAATGVHNGNIIHDNEIYSADVGIYLDNSDYQQIYDNNIHDHSTIGIYLYGSDNNFIDGFNFRACPRIILLTVLRTNCT